MPLSFLVMRKFFPVVFAISFLFLSPFIRAETFLKSYFNHEKTVGIEFLVTQSEIEINLKYYGYMKNPPEAAAAKEAIQFLKKQLKIRMAGNALDQKAFSRIIQGTDIPYRQELDSFFSNNPKITVEIGSDENTKVLSAIQYDSSNKSLSEIPNIGSKFAVSFFRTLGQFKDRNEIFIKWLKQDRNPVDMDTYKSRVDLHTHFGGALETGELLRIAKKNKIPYPVSFLKKLGIDGSQLEHVKDDSHVILDEDKLSEPDRNTLRNILTLNTFQVGALPDMEVRYFYRTPLTKHEPSFEDYLWSLARNYQQSGIELVELSLSDIVKPGWLQIAHRVLPQIKQETGVRILFLVGLWRHMDPPLYNYELLRVVREIKSPYIVGIDVMGHETNRTDEDLIRAARKIRDENRPQFVVRVHAGESNQNPENVKEAILSGATRIGHGLNGISKEVLELAKERDVIVEINLNSNLALSNIQSIDQVVQLLKTYIAAGVRITFGTDGHGLYETSNASEFESARYLGLTTAEFLKVKVSDQKYIDQMETGFSKDSMTFPADLDFSQLPSIKITSTHWNWTNSNTEHKRTNLIKSIERQNVPLLDASLEPNSQLHQFEASKRPVLFVAGGASRWFSFDEKTRQEYSNVIRFSQSQLDLEKIFFVTSGTSVGSDGLFYDNQYKSSEFAQPLALFPLSISRNLFEKENKAAAILGDDWPKRNELVLDFLKSRNGVVIFLDAWVSTTEFLQAVNNAAPESVKQPGVQFLVYRDSKSEVIPLFLHKLNPQHVFATPNELRTRLIELDLLGKKDNHQTGDSFSHSELRARFNPDPKLLPRYCLSPEIEITAIGTYHHRFVNRSKEWFEVPSPQEGDQEIEELISRNARSNRPWPVKFRNLFSQTTFYDEFIRYMDVFGMPLSLDPRFPYYLFSTIKPAQVQALIQRKMGDGENINQMMAIFCSYLDRYAIKNLSAFPIPDQWPLIAPLGDHSIDHVQKEFDLKVSDKSKEALWYRDNRFVFYDDLFPKIGDKVPDYLIKIPPAEEGKKLFVLVKGTQGYDKAAVEIRSQLQAKDVTAVIFGTDVCIADVWLKHYFQTGEDMPWLPHREQSRAMRLPIARKLIENKAPVILYATQGTDPNETLSDIIEPAKLEGYKVLVIKPNELTFDSKQRGDKKAEARYLADLNIWNTSEFNIKGSKVKQISQKQFTESLSSDQWDFRSFVKALPEM